MQEAPIHFECKLERVLELGPKRQALMIGEVVHIDVDPAVMTRKLAEAKAWAVVNAEAQRMQAAAAAGTSSTGGGGAASSGATSSSVAGATGGSGDVGGAVVEGPAVVVAPIPRSLISPSLPEPTLPIRLARPARLPRPIVVQ